MPDAVLKIPRQAEMVAVELELTVKSEKRYREILLHYRLSEKFSQILYISNDIGVLKKVQSVLTGRNIKAGELENTVDDFVFLTTGDLENTNTRELLSGLAFENHTHQEEVNV
jgi:beta-lactamase superfamily II metal-dependent hydrolase